MTVKENNTEAELLTVERPFAWPACACKCCCYQQATITSGGQELGNIKEGCYFCVPSFTVVDHKAEPLYVVHAPTCIGGMCVNCCAEGNPCGRGCCLQSFRVYPYAQKGQTDGDAPYIGKVGRSKRAHHKGTTFIQRLTHLMDVLCFICQILKKPKSMMTEIFTDAVRVGPQNLFW